LRRLVIDLDSLDATIRLFAPHIDLDDIRPKPLPARNHAFRGEMARTVLNLLRQAPKPLHAHDIALTFMASRKLGYSRQATSPCHTEVRGGVPAELSQQGHSALG
jgi:hypothetical protein